MITVSQYRIPGRPSYCTLIECSSLNALHNRYSSFIQSHATKCEKIKAKKTINYLKSFKLLTYYYRKITWIISYFFKIIVLF